MNLVHGASLHGCLLRTQPHPSMCLAPERCVGFGPVSGLGRFCSGGLLQQQRDRQALGLRSRQRRSRFGTGSEGCKAQLALPDVASIAPVTAAVYGASLLGGGLYAFTRTGSKGSLSGGITGGVALGVAFFLMQVPETRDLGNAVAFGAAVLFAFIFGIRVASTGKVVPSGLLLGGSALATVIFANAYFQTRL